MGAWCHPSPGHCHLACIPGGSWEEQDPAIKCKKPYWCRPPQNLTPSSATTHDAPTSHFTCGVVSVVPQMWGARPSLGLQRQAEGRRDRVLVFQPSAQGGTSPKGGTAHTGTWGIPTDAGGEEVPVDLAQELGQGAGEEGEVELVSDEVPSPAQETHQGLGIGVQLCGFSKRAVSPAPCQTSSVPQPCAIASSHRIASAGHGMSHQQCVCSWLGPERPGRTSHRRSRDGCARGAAARGPAGTGPAGQSSLAPGCQEQL